MNDAFARKHFPNGTAIGQRVSFTQDDAGLVRRSSASSGNIKHRGLDGADRPELYVPYRQPLFTSWTVRPMFVVVRTAGEPADRRPAVRAEIARIDRDQPISDVRTMDARIARSLTARRFNTVLLALFAALALRSGGDRHLRRASPTR